MYLGAKVTLFEFTGCMVLHGASMLGGPGCQPNHLIRVCPMNYQQDQCTLRRAR